MPRSVTKHQDQLPLENTPTIRQADRQHRGKNLKVFLSFAHQRTPVQQTDQFCGLLNYSLPTFKFLCSFDQTKTILSWAKFLLVQAVDLCVKFHKVHDKGPPLISDISYNKNLYSIKVLCLTKSMTSRQVMRHKSVFCKSCLALGQISNSDQLQIFFFFKLQMSFTHPKPMWLKKKLLWGESTDHKQNE